MKIYTTCNAVGWTADNGTMLLGVAVLPDGSAAAVCVPIVHGKEKESLVALLTCKHHPIKRLAMVPASGKLGQIYEMDVDELVVGTMRQASSGER